jgi:hypothetical protein
MMKTDQRQAMMETTRDDAAADIQSWVALLYQVTRYGYTRNQIL